MIEYIIDWCPVLDPREESWFLMGEVSASRESGMIKLIVHARFSAKFERLGSLESISKRRDELRVQFCPWLEPSGI